MRQDVTFATFIAGELSPRLLSRTDYEKFYDGAKLLLNYVVQPQGGVTRRPGTMLGGTYTASQGSRLVDFVFSASNAYMLEVNDSITRIYANGGVVVDESNNPVTLTTPWLAADLPNLSWTQSGDQLIVYCPGYTPQVISRTSATAFSIADRVVYDGPYLDVNETATTLTVTTPDDSSLFSGTDGFTLSPPVDLKVTASAVTGINGGSGFTSNDVGRHLRLRQQGVWAWFIIKSITSTTVIIATLQKPNPNGAFGLDGAGWATNTYYPTGYVVKANGAAYVAKVGGYSGDSTTSHGVQGPNDPGRDANASAIADGQITWAWTDWVPQTTKEWQLGRYTLTNQPTLGSFWAGRLVELATPDAPEGVFGSVVQDFFNMAPSQADGQVLADNAFAFLLADEEVNAIHWIRAAGSAQTMQLALGTNAGEIIIQPGTQSQAIGPTNVQSYRETSYGSRPSVRPLRIGKALLFSNRSGKKLFEWSFLWQVNGYIGLDITEQSEHLLARGIKRLAWQQNPNNVVWMLTNDGQLVGMTYLKDQTIAALHRHQLGGSFQGGPPIIDDIAVVPDTSGLIGDDQLWLAVTRTINGSTVRTVEMMAPFFNSASANLENAVFVDCSISGGNTAQSGTLSFSNYSYTNAAGLGETPSLSGTTTVVSGSSSHSFTLGQIIRANYGSLKVVNVSSSHTATAITLQPLRSFQNLPAYFWTLGTHQSTISGLGIFASTNVDVLADGVPLLDVPVSSGGSITLTTPASMLTAGLPCPAKLITMPAESAKGAASTAGKTKRSDTVYLRLQDSLGGIYGVHAQDDFTHVIYENSEYLEIRQTSQAMDSATPLFSGILRLRPPAGFDMDGSIFIEEKRPVPSTVLGIGLREDVQEITPQ